MPFCSIYRTPLRQRIVLIHKLDETGNRLAMINIDRQLIQSIWSHKIA